MKTKILIVLCTVLFSALKGINLTRNTILNHPLLLNENLFLLYRLAHKISYKIDILFPDKKKVLIGLGQSPAYFLELIRLIDIKKNVLIVNI